MNSARIRSVVELLGMNPDNLGEFALAADGKAICLTI